MANRRYFVRILPLIFLPILLLLCSCIQSVAANINMAWDQSVSPDISRHKVYIGNRSGIYSAPITIRGQTSHAAIGLANGTYYFAVTAFDINGIESDFLNEAFQTIGTSTTTCDANGDFSITMLDLQALSNIIQGIGPSSSNLDLN